jgi:peptidoglycan/LPS O-acetylase OafA/YrhL
MAAPPAADHAALRKERVMPRPGTRPVDALDVLVFIVELVLFAILAVAGARLGSDSTAIALAVLLPLVTALLWGMYLAPRASRRLPHRRRLVAKLAVMLAASALLVGAGAVAWGIAFLLAGGTLVTVGALREAGADRSGPRPNNHDRGFP